MNQVANRQCDLIAQLEHAIATFDRLAVGHEADAVRLRIEAQKYREWLERERARDVERVA